MKTTEEKILKQLKKINKNIVLLINQDVTVSLDDGLSMSRPIPKRPPHEGTPTGAQAMKPNV